MRTLRVTPIGREEHLRFVSGLPEASFLQCPSWADVKVDWRSESLGWTDPSGSLIGSALVLYRRTPALDRYLAYIPEGPLIDWRDDHLAGWLEPLLDRLRSRRAFTLKMGPPLSLRRWRASTLKQAISDGVARKLHEVQPEVTDGSTARVTGTLLSMGWVPGASRTSGYGTIQPRYIVELPLAGRTLNDVWKGFSQLWRRNVRKSERAGVEVVIGGYEDLPVFYDLLTATQNRNRFDLGRSLPYYQRQYRALTAEDPNRMRLYLARHGDDILAAHTMNVVGSRAWYQLGGSANQKRHIPASYALQWRMIQDAYALGASAYDMRGVTDLLDPSAPGFGLLQWKLGTGGDVVELFGEWDFPLNRSLSRLFERYMALRGRWSRRRA